MSKLQKGTIRSWTLMPWIPACLAIALMVIPSPLVAGSDGDRDQVAAHPCGGWSDEATSDGSTLTFPVPAVRESRDGILRTTLHACVATKEMLDQNAQPAEIAEFHPPTFEGTIPGPTLEVKPGDELSIFLVNDLPGNPTKQRGNAFPHDENTINLHAHGLTVSPLGISDNVFREMKPGTTHLVQIDIPKDHPSGTFWYHVHKHGAATYQFLGGMAGFLIVRGGAGTLDTVPEVAAARDVPMAFQVVRAINDGKVVFVNQKTKQFGTYPFPKLRSGTFPSIRQQGLWSTYGLDGGPPLAPGGGYPGKPSRFSYTTNGVANPTLHMRPGEVQRWRLLNATDGDNLQLVLVSKEAGNQGLGLNIVAMDGITVPRIYRLKPGDPLVIGPGQRMDVMIKADKPGNYVLETLDPNSGAVKASVSPYRDYRNPKFADGIDPAQRVSRHSFDFPGPCPALGNNAADCKAKGLFSYPVTLVTVAVSGKRKDMKLPAGPLPTPQGLPSIARMLSKKPDAVRHIAFEICSNVKPFMPPENRLPSCGWYFLKYNPVYWGGAPFNTLEMMRDADDVGVPTGNKVVPRINYQKDGLFDPTKPLFPDMIAGNYEEWTVYNRTFSDHPFHMHQNHMLITKINGTTLPLPEWHDTLDVPAATCRQPLCPPGNLNDVVEGSITFRTYFNPVTVGCFVAHCHTLDHEDIGMMQRFDILPAKGGSSGCGIDTHTAALPLIERLVAGGGSFEICSAPRQSYRLTPPSN